MSNDAQLLKTIDRLDRALEGCVRLIEQEMPQMPADLNTPLGRAKLALNASRSETAYLRRPPGQKQTHDFQDGLSRKLTEHGVPAGLSWPDAIDWLARHGGQNQTTEA